MRAYSSYEQGLWDQAVAHLEQAVDFAVARHGRSYAFEWLAGLLREMRSAAGADPVRPRYQKKVIPAALRTAVFERDAYRCVQCGSWKDLRADHVVPEVHGGPTTLENLQTLCQPCNSRKGARLEGSS